MQVDAGSILWYVLQEKGKLKKEGHKYRVSSMVEMKPLVESRIPFFCFWFLCAQKLSFLDHGRGIYMLWLGQVGSRWKFTEHKIGR